MGWFLKKEWVDRDDDIETVHIHFAFGPVHEKVNWSNSRSWPMPNGSSLISALASDGHHERVLDGRVRQQVLKMPLQVWDENESAWTSNYLLHYYYEVFQAGRRWTTEIFSDEIVYRDLDYVDWEGRLSEVSIFWSVSDWSAPVWVPAEDSRFFEVFGSEHERCARRFYQFPDKPRFALEKWNLMKQLPLPWYWRARIYGPKGTIVRQRWHTGNLSNGINWEDWDPHLPADFVHFL